MTAIVAFEAAARHESFLLASAELSLTPSAISHQVRNLEAWFGRKLFVRATRSLSLTEDGRRLLGELSLALTSIAAACAVLRPRALRLQLSVHCAPSFAAKWLAPRLPGFMKAHPDLAIRLTSGAESVNLGRNASIDVHIAYGVAPSAKGVVVVPLGTESITPLCSPKLFPQGRRMTPQDLMGLVLIESQLSPVSWGDWCRHNGLKKPRHEGPSFDRGALAVAAAVDGLGVALETQRFAQTELERGELVALTGRGLRAIRRPLHFMCHRSAGEQPAGLVDFSAWLMNQIHTPSSLTHDPVSHAES